MTRSSSRLIWTHIIISEDVACATGLWRWDHSGGRDARHLSLSLSLVYGLHSQDSLGGLRTPIVIIFCDGDLNFGEVLLDRIAGLEVSKHSL